MNIMDSPDDSPINIVGKTMHNAYFDEVIGHIEDLILSEEFVVLHNEFLEEHWQFFEDTEENRLEYMEIFLKYIATFENYLVQQLHKRMKNFEMQRFANELSKEYAESTVELNYEIFDLLNSFNNFEIFKELMLDYRCSKERTSQNMDFDSILITKRIFVKEQKIELNATVEKCDIVAMDVDKNA